MFEKVRQTSENLLMILLEIIIMMHQLQLTNDTSRNNMMQQ